MITVDVKSPATGLFQVSVVSNSVILFKYETQAQLCSAFLRFEEYYESPEWKGKVFTLGQYREWYSKFRGTWSYLKDWSGFNVPSSAMQVFINGLFDPLTAAEAELLDFVRYKQGPFCVIGTSKDSASDVYEHEICHAMFSLNEGYREAVLSLIAEHDLTELRTHLRGMGYNESVIDDECHAYLCESHAFLDAEKISYPPKLPGELKATKARFIEDAILEKEEVK